MSDQPCRVCGAQLCLEHCVYCGVDCSPALGLDHASDCPFSTGVWPAKPGDCCAECGEPLGVYCAMVPIDPAGRATLIVCIGCKVAIGVGIQDVTP